MLRSSPAIFRATLPEEYRPEIASKYLKNKLRIEGASGGVSSFGEHLAKPLWILLAITGAVLLIAGANLANLLLARASAREREMAVRQALGASRGRLLTQLLIESLLLSECGTVLGMILAQAIDRGLIAFLNGDQSAIVAPNGFNWHVFGFLSGLAMLTCLLFGLAPAMRATDRRPAAAMQGGRSFSDGRERNGLRRTLVVTQVGLSVVLVVGALLFTASLRKLLRTQVGWRWGWELRCCCRVMRSRCYLICKRGTHLRLRWRCCC